MHRQADPPCTAAIDERGSSCGEPLTLFRSVQQGLDAVTDVFGRHLFFAPKIVDHSSGR
jgi:hypothetical protein